MKRGFVIAMWTGLVENPSTGRPILFRSPESALRALRRMPEWGWHACSIHACSVRAKHRLEETAGGAEAAREDHEHASDGQPWSPPPPPRLYCRKGRLVNLCPFCGDPAVTDVLCAKDSCAKASASIPIASRNSLGVPRIRGKGTQSEERRVRKPMKLRLLPAAKAKLVAYAMKQGADASALVERWILSLPDD